jgi:hypothetical protein
LSIKVGQYDFDGPFTQTESLWDRAGIYVILCQSSGPWNVVDVGESDTVKSRVEGHDRKGCWKRSCSGTLGYAALYTPNWTDAQRRQVEQAIRQQYNPPCGER